MSFGRIYQYLLARGRITPQTLQQIMTHQHESSLDPADYALRFGHIGPADVRRIRIAQVKMNASFFTAALDLGLMNQQQIDAVREAQNAATGELGDRLQELGLLSSEECTQAMRAFMDEQVHFAESVMQLPPDIPERGAILRMLEITIEMFERYWAMDATALDLDVCSRSLALSDHNVVVSLTGAISMRYYLGIGRACVDAAGLELIGEPIGTDDERDDVVRELANVSCGHGLAMLATQGKRVDMDAPRSVGNRLRLGDDRAVTATLMTPFGPAVFAMAFGTSSDSP